MTFEVFMEKVDAILEAKYGVVSLDLPDFGYRVWFDAKSTPALTAKMAVKNAVNF